MLLNAIILLPTFRNKSLILTTQLLIIQIKFSLPYIQLAELNPKSESGAAHRYPARINLLILYTILVNFGMQCTKYPFSNMFAKQTVNAVFFIAMHKSYSIDYTHKLYEQNFSLEKPHSNNFVLIRLIPALESQTHHVNVTVCVYLPALVGLVTRCTRWDLSIKVLHIDT